MIDLNLLNIEQIEAVEYDGGPLLILAGAGSGKTRVITYKISYLIESGIDYRSILAMTFTNKAADEMKERVKQLISDENKTVFISTFHKFCGRVLRNFIDRLGYNNNFTIYDTLDQKKLISEIKKDLGFDNIKEKSVVNTISYLKSHNIQFDDYYKDKITENDKNTYLCIKEYIDRMFKVNAIDFDDMLILTVKLLNEHKDIKDFINNRFKYVLVDEYQDTNSIQFELIKLLSPNGEHLTVVGDDDQSIYKFRGANISNILNFEDSFKNTKIIKLTQNYRSTNNILNLANSVISHNIGRMGKNLWSENGDGDKPIYINYPNDKNEAYKTIFNIKEINDYKNTAILYRKNSQSRSLEESCIQLNVPYVIIGGIEFYERKEVKDVLAYLRIASNENDIVSFHRVINIPRRGIGDTSVQKLIDYSNVNNITIFDSLNHAKDIGIKGKALDGINKFVDIINNIKNKTEIEHMIDVILEVGEYENYLVDEFGRVEADDRLDNIKELKNKASSFKMFLYSQSIDESLKEYKENMSGIELLNEFLNELALVSPTDNINDNESKLTMMTLHASKGLEYDNIYIVGMNEGTLPSNMSLEFEDDIEEERRLCYVGITRAKKHLTLSSFKYGFINGQYLPLEESRFVSEMDNKYLNKINLSNDLDFNDNYYNKPNYKNNYKNNFSTIKYNKKNNYNFDSDEKIKNKFKINIDNAYTTGKNIVKSDKLEYDIGDRVTHIKFGEGIVKNIINQPTDYEVTVLFDDFGEKCFYAAFAKLKKV